MTSPEESTLSAIRASMGGLQPPGNYQMVYKDECMFSFESPESEGGLFINLRTFQGFSEHYALMDHTKSGNALYLHEKWKKIPLNEEELEASKAAPEKMAIGGEGGFNIGAPKYKFDKERSLVVFPSRMRIPLPCPDLPELVIQVIDAIVSHDSASAQEDLSVWEEERRTSRYAEGLTQLDNGRKISPNPKDWRCDETGATENLWLNLSTGFIGSGRRNWDGSGGNGSALRHFQDTGNKYPLVVKLGTITPHGADVYSYAPDEDDMVSDPHLADHLAHWGINMMQMEKTEKTMAELQIGLNLSYEFGRITESGTALRPLYGPGHVGLINLGNSCYMNSVLQILLTIPEIRARYVDLGDHIFRTAPSEPANDMAAQLAKVSRALALGLTGRALPGAPSSSSMDTDQPAAVQATEDDLVKANAVRPYMFKSIFGKGHAEFSSGRQQDALEYFQYMLEQISRIEHANGERLSLSAIPPTKSAFTFSYEDRVQCLESERVSYKQRVENTVQVDIPLEAAINKEEVESYRERELKRQKLKDANAEAYIGSESRAVTRGGAGDEEQPIIPKVPFSACLERLSGDEILEDYHSVALGRRSTASKRTRFSTFPPYLMVALRRYYVGEGWVPKKMDVLVDMPDRLDLESLRGRGPQPHEVLQPADANPSAPTTPLNPITEIPPVVPDEELVTQLVSMGFQETVCRRAAIATWNAGVEMAMEWVLTHMDDDETITVAGPSVVETSSSATPISSGTGVVAPSGGADVEKISMLTAMGFADQQAEAALLACNGNIERAADWLFSHMDDMDSAVRTVLEGRAQQTQGATGGSAVQSRSEANIAQDGPGVYELVGFISHMGSNTACGHYVCHIKKEGRWVIFNDEKVAESENPPKDIGYIYLYSRIQK
ncbi:hypothetical protein CEUSTIGMA_g10029.t1 [Chlamydomonas eustigma]|uniref:Ubiquitin carboxyl-terminal hydrolase n=1 Tax=Chlamydomonas eustigma TaxID=1157962 RepID=A0A250XHT0_9CHLO|nr:hypothetical protein CEUSTIGMA_g10029.t1 [Chlamydomonas eustigma]|eukprot:GAX82603.1 hypothetical protein CEUSTIGMA_g10029.t1 [Chlamydomonas eustigma]